MNHIKTRKHPTGASRPRPNLVTATLLGGLALSGHAAAADLADAADEGRSTTTLDGLEVKGVHGYKAEQVASPKFTQSLQDTPQTLQVITADLFNQQGATTLTEALRNTPGVGTFFAGENGSTNTGDTVYMRGFDTSSSIFVDGVRDLGSISRDVFNTEQVEVTKGPAGTDNGRSAPTGAINMVSKQANLQQSTSAMISGGSDGQKRATADWNETLGENAALRLNALWQDSDVAGRDHVNNSRWGVAPSLGLGLGTNTRYFLNLYYVKQDNIPDGFVPTIGLPGWQPQEGLEQLAGHPVDPENFYGTRDDHDNVKAQMATFRFEHDFSESVRLSNIARWGKSEQDYLLTSFMGTGTFKDSKGVVHYDANGNPIPQGNIRWTDADDLSTYTLARSNNLKDQENTILTDQLNLRLDFATGGVTHNLSTGLELTREEQETFNTTSTGSRPAANLYDPDWNDAGDLSWARNGTGSFGRTDTASVYLFDTLDFGDNFLVTAGLRADRFRSQYSSTNICNTAGTSGGARGAVYCGTLPLGSVVSAGDAELEDTLVNWKLGAVYKVGNVVSLYANYALSQQPPGGSNFQLNETAGNANNINMDPQKAQTVEAGTKWSFLDDALALQLALFRTEVTNEITGSAAEGYFQDGKKRVQGVEVSTVGSLTQNWSISAGYTHQQAKVEEGAPLANNGSPNLTYTPEDAFTSWTTYRFASGLTVGGGVRYSGEMLRGTDGAVGTPAFAKSYTVWDAVVSYPVSERVLLRLNGFNLFDKEYVAAINKSGYRYTPGTPRSFLLTAELRF